MPEPPKITTSLAERIAKLNANVSQEKSGLGSSSSTLPGEIKSKISRYEASGQHEAPLIPKASFGLGAPTVAPSRGLDRIRIASSGVSGGQTLAPPRSAEATDRRSFSAQQQPHHSQRSSKNSDLSQSPPTNSSRTRHSLDPNFSNAANLSAQSLAPIGPPTPGAMSLASAQAQPGSDLNSPLTSPLATPLASHNYSFESTHHHTDPEEIRVEETRQALQRFEAEEHDPVVRPSTDLVSSLVSYTEESLDSTALHTAGGAGGAPIEPPPMEGVLEPERENITEQDGNESTTESHEAYDGILDAYPSSSSASGSIHAPDEHSEFPQVKCADCSRPLSLLELSDHVCSPTREVEAAKPQLSPVRPVPADVPIDAHETGSDGDGLDVSITVNPTSESEPDDLPEEIDVSEAEEAAAVDQHQSEPTSAPTEPAPDQLSPVRPSPRSLEQCLPKALPSSPNNQNLPSPRSLGPGSARNSWYDDEDDGPQEVTGYATIVRRSRG